MPPVQLRCTLASGWSSTSLAPVLGVAGLVVAQDYKRGQQLVADRDFDVNADFFQDVFEIGRRYKIMNPEKMRSEFGKLMYMLMDSADSTVQVWPRVNTVTSGLLLVL